MQWSMPLASTSAVAVALRTISTDRISLDPSQGVAYSEVDVHGAHEDVREVEVGSLPNLFVESFREPTPLPKELGRGLEPIVEDNLCQPLAHGTR